MTKVKQIKQLPSGTYRLLCSGQIITSVFSVVKELVENSLDSGCSSIDVKLENYGLDRIEVRDNGCGIHSDDIPYVIKSHYTSKISSFADLETLHTYGFRGEALGALCCIADVTICSKTLDEDVSRTYTFNNKGEIQTSKPSASPQGTTVIAANLFKNIPVRKQIYKSEKTKKEEMKKIESFLCAFACSELGIRFALYHNRNVIWQKSAVSDIRSAMIQVYGSSAVNNMVPICSSDENLEVKLEGFFPKPDAPVSSLSYSNSDGTIVVINKRPVRIKEIDKILLSSYSQSVSSNGSKTRYPLCFISISLPPKKIDVNIEPNKTRVLLHSMEGILGFLSEAIGKVCHAVLPEKRTEIHAIRNLKSNEISVSTDTGCCIESLSDLSSKKSACENGGPIISKNNMLYTGLETGNNTSRKETSKNSPSIANGNSSHLINHDHVAKDKEKLSESSVKHVSGSAIGGLFHPSESFTENFASENISKISQSIANGVSSHLINHDHVVNDKEKLSESYVTHISGNGISGNAEGGLFHPSESFAKYSASENIRSKSSALISDTFYPKYDSDNSGFKSDTLEIPSSVASHFLDHSRKAGNAVLKSMENLSENFVELIASNQACGVAEKEFSFIKDNSNDQPKYNDDHLTLHKICSDTIGISSTEYMVSDECLPKSSPLGSSFTVLKSCNIESNGSLNNMTSANKSFCSAVDSDSLLIPNTNLNGKVHTSIPKNSHFTISQGVQNILQPCGSESSSSVIHQTVVDTYMNSLTSVDNCSSELSSLPNKRTLNDFQSGSDFLTNAGSVQTVTVPCNSKLSTSSNNNTSLKEYSNLPSGCVNFDPKGNQDSETVKRDKQDVPVLLESMEFDSISGKMLNSNACDKKSILNSVSAAAERNDWCLGNLKDSEGKKIEPVAILTKSLIKRSVQEEDTVLEVKRKKPSGIGDIDTNALDFETKQPPPKKNLSAFGLFCRDFRLEVALQNHGQSNQNIAKVLTERWNNLAPDKKGAYEERAKGNDASCLKVKKKLGKTLSQTLGALNKKKKPVSQKSTLDQVLIRKRKVNVVQFTMEDLKAKITLSSSKCREANKDENYSVISCLSPGSWICLKGCELLLLNSFRLHEMLIYCRLMETYVFPSEKLNIPIALNDGVLIDDDSLQVLGELVQDSYVQKRTLVADKRITSNGFKITIGNDGHTASLVEMPSCLPFCGISDLLEILRHLKQKRENATVFSCRPTKAIHYLQGEAVRIVRQSPNNLRKDEVEDLLRKKESMLAESGSVCLHNKPFFHVLHKIDSPQSLKFDFQDY